MRFLSIEISVCLFIENKERSRRTIDNDRKSIEIKIVVFNHL
jgi:hypothetical protein